MKHVLLFVVFFLSFNAQSHESDNYYLQSCNIPTVVEYSSCKQQNVTIRGCARTCPKGQQAVCESGYVNEEGTPGPWGCSYQIIPASCQCW